MTQVALWPAPFPLLELLDVFKTLTGLQVVLSNAPRKQLGQTGGEKAWIIVHSTTSRELGVDEYRVRSDPSDLTGGTLQANLCGQRLYTVSLRAESLDAGPSPVSILERVRWGLRTMTSFLALDALGVAVSDFEAIQHIAGQSSDNRALLVAVLDIHFNWALNFSPPSDDGGTIELVNGSNQQPGSPITIAGDVIVGNIGGSTFDDGVSEILIPITKNSTTQSSTSLIPAGAQVVDCALVTPDPSVGGPAFDTGTTIKVGNSVLPDCLMTTADNTPDVAGTYDAPQNTPWGNIPLSAMVTVAGNPTAGSGVVSVKYLTPTS